MKIVAIAGPSVLGGAGLDTVRARLTAPGAAPGYAVIPSFSSIANLFTRIKALLAANNFDVLEVLEIMGHGNPGLSDGVTKLNAATFGAGLRGISLNDVTEIYLSGCNTGVTDGSQPVAQIVSMHTPTEAADSVRVTVHGTVGYLLLAGTNAEGTAKTIKEVVPLHPAFPDRGDGINRGVYPGSRAAIGAACYRAFREGARV